MIRRSTQFIALKYLTFSRDAESVVTNSLDCALFPMNGDFQNTARSVAA